MLQTARTVSLGGTRFHAIVASKRYTLKSGQAKTLKVKLPKGVRALSRRGTLASTRSPRTATRRATSPSARRGSRSSWSASRLGGARRVPLHQLALHAAGLRALRRAARPAAVLAGLRLGDFDGRVVRVAPPGDATAGRLRTLGSIAAGRSAMSRASSRRPRTRRRLVASSWEPQRWQPCQLRARGHPQQRGHEGGERPCCSRVLRLAQRRSSAGRQAQRAIAGRGLSCALGAGRRAQAPRRGGKLQLDPLTGTPRSFQNFSGVPSGPRAVRRPPSPWASRAARRDPRPLQRRPRRSRSTQIVTSPSEHHSVRFAQSYRASRVRQRPADQPRPRQPRPQRRPAPRSMTSPSTRWRRSCRPRRRSPR